jgi:hypothetical protein
VHQGTGLQLHRTDCLEHPQNQEFQAEHPSEAFQDDLVADLDHQTCHPFDPYQLVDLPCHPFDPYQLVDLPCLPFEAYQLVDLPFDPYQAVVPEPSVSKFQKKRLDLHQSDESAIAKISFTVARAVIKMDEETIECIIIKRE